MFITYKLFINYKPVQRIRWNAWVMLLVICWSIMLHHFKFESNKRKYQYYITLISGFRGHACLRFVYVCRYVCIFIIFSVSVSAWEKSGCLCLGMCLQVKNSGCLCLCQCLLRNKVNVCVCRQGATGVSADKRVFVRGTLTYIISQQSSGIKSYSENI